MAFGSIADWSAADLKRWLERECEQSPGLVPASMLRGTLGFDATVTIAARVSNSTAQAIPPGQNTTLTFNVEDLDTAELHSTSVHTSRLTAPVAGVYVVAAGVGWASTVLQQVQLLRSGGVITSVNRTVLHEQVSDLAYFDAGQYLEAKVLQVSGGTVDATAHLAMAKLP